MTHCKIDELFTHVYVVGTIPNSWGKGPKLGISSQRRWIWDYITGINKLIPHALDAPTADIIIQDLALIHPFAELAIQICFPDNTAMMYLYCHYLFINYNKPFDTLTVTNYMCSLTSPICSFPIGVRDWRQIHTTLAHKHCGQAGQLVKMGAQATMQILQYGHGWSVHDSIYRWSGNAQGGSTLPEDVLPLHLTASTEWQLETLTVPGERPSQSSI